MGILFIWIVFALLVGVLGNERTTGFWGGFFLALLLSPLIGGIIVLASKSKSDLKFQNDLLARQKQQTEALKRQAVNQQSVATELEKLKAMRDSGDLSQEEFQKLKNKLIDNSIN
ncbi:MAG: SHOCT domain-containing protein [Ginsengibacter sp.]